MKLKNKLRRRLLPIISKKKLKVSDEIKFKESIVGKVLIDGEYPFALMKIFDPEFQEFSKQSLRVNEFEVQILIPSCFDI